jgi:hypothetical protein
MGVVITMGRAVDPVVVALTTTAELVVQASWVKVLRVVTQEVLQALMVVREVVAEPAGLELLDRAKSEGQEAQVEPHPSQAFLAFMQVAVVVEVVPVVLAEAQLEERELTAQILPDCRVQ